MNLSLISTLRLFLLPQEDHYQTVYTWRRYNPDWEILIYIDRDKFFNELEASRPAIVAMMRRLTVRGQIVDLARYGLLAEVGGLYADLDIDYISNKGLSELLRCNESKYDFIAFVEREESKLMMWSKLTRTQQMYRLLTAVCHLENPDTSACPMKTMVSNYLFATKPKSKTIERIIEIASTYHIRMEG